MALLLFVLNFVFFLLLAATTLALALLIERLVLKARAITLLQARLTSIVTSGLVVTLMWKLAVGGWITGTVSILKLTLEGALFLAVAVIGASLLNIATINRLRQKGLARPPEDMVG